MVQFQIHKTKPYYMQKCCHCEKDSICRVLIRGNDYRSYPRNFSRVIDYYPNQKFHLCQECLDILKEDISIIRDSLLMERNL